MFFQVKVDPHQVRVGPDQSEKTKFYEVIGLEEYKIMWDQYNVGAPFNSQVGEHDYNFTYGFLVLITVVKWGLKPTYNVWGCLGMFWGPTLQK